MLVCSVSQPHRRAAIAADVAEAAAALDAPGTGNVVFATLVDDPASVGDRVDAYLGEIMLEAASSADAVDASVPATYDAAIVEAASAADTQSAAAGLTPPLDAVASVTGAWSLSRNMLTSFGSGTRYTKTGTAITALKDQSGNSRDFTDAGTANRRPAEITAFPSSIICADFNGVLDGSGNWLESVAISNFLSASSGAIIASIIIDAVSINTATIYANHGIMADVSQYIGLFARNLSGVSFYSYNYDGSVDSSSATGAINTPYVLMWRHHGGNIYFSINGGTEVSVASGNTQVITGALRMGAGGATSSACDMKLAEAFVTSDGSQTAALAAAIANMKTYCGA